MNKILTMLIIVIALQIGFYFLMVEVIRPLLTDQSIAILLDLMIGAIWGGGLVYYYKYKL